jgi:hypothetical protein
VSSKDDTFSKERGHESREKFSTSFGPKYFLLWEAVLYRSVQFVQLCGFGMKIETFSGTVFEADFSFFVVVSGSYEIVCTADRGHRKRGTEEAVQKYDFGTENETDFCGIDLAL